MYKKIRAILNCILVTLGAIALVMIILAFTSAPFWIWYKLGVKDAGIHRPPDYIIVMGGGGMPSHSALMRCWYASRAAQRFPASRIIIALPGDARDSLSSVNQMKKEMQLRGVAPERIYLEDSGTNTRAEALNVFKLISNIDQRILNNEPPAPPSPVTRHPSPVTRHASPVTRHPSPVTRHPSRVTRHASLLLVTSPQHLHRAVLAFKKAGFLKVDGLPAFEKAIESDLDFNARKLGARPWMPDVGNNISVRYQFWMQMEYEFLVLREYLALAYYKLQGWI
jgi:uncharacterized SAM-binding protein YcdF (DUF218 family)